MCVITELKKYVSRIPDGEIKSFPFASRLKQEAYLCKYPAMIDVPVKIDGKKITVGSFVHEEERKIKFAAIRKRRIILILNGKGYFKKTVVIKRVPC